VLTGKPENIKTQNWGKSIATMSKVKMSEHGEAEVGARCLKYAAAPQRKNDRARADNENRTKVGPRKQIGPFEVVMRQSKDKVELTAASGRKVGQERCYLPGRVGR
jgi:hypothetical protein